MCNILIWGTGAGTKKLLENGVSGRIIGFIDAHKIIDEYNGLPVYGIDEIPKSYDYIIVANRYSGEIYKICQRKHIGLEKVIFLYGIKISPGYSDLMVIRQILGEKNYTNYCAEYGLSEHSFWKEDLISYSNMNTRKSFEIEEKYLYPIIKDKYANAGDVGSYFWQDLWAARLIYKSGIKEHFDIGSRVDGFIAHLLSMNIDVTLIDIRELPNKVEGLHTIIDDATSLNHIKNESIISMSALCSLEHFGLGRYGDTIDSEACFKCFGKIMKKIKKGGNLYISVPIGKEHIEFNAHRVFYADTIVKAFNELKLVEFSCTFNGEIEYNIETHKYDNDMRYGGGRFGLFHFIKE